MPLEYTQLFRYPQKWDSENMLLSHPFFLSLSENQEAVDKFLKRPIANTGQIQLDLAHRRTDANCIHRKDNAPKPLVPITSEL